ncbi:MAG: hypothetical protein IJQ14_04995 [Bacteroidales bacterium]|jgi:hypothetical protein|nr:hypothetical protein [Bacteroidaceae bacterium]MBR0170181.1 hypothetical protein [Bacteroidales bacterium]
MTEITLRVTNESLLPSFRKLIRSIDGIDIVPAKRKRKSGIEQALEDVAAGRVTEWKSADEMFKTLMAEA